MSEQEMIDAAIAAHETGEWGAWLEWLLGRGIRYVTLEPPAYTGSLTTGAGSGITIVSASRYAVVRRIGGTP